MVKEDSELAESNIPWWLTGGRSGAFKNSINLKGSKCPHTLHCEPLGNQLCPINHRDCIFHAMSGPNPHYPQCLSPPIPVLNTKATRCLETNYRAVTDPKTRFRGVQAYLGAQAARGKIARVNCISVLETWLLLCFHIGSSKMGTQPLSTISGTLDFHPGAEVVSHTT